MFEDLVLLDELLNISANFKTLIPYFAAIITVSLFFALIMYHRKVMKVQVVNIRNCKLCKYTRETITQINISWEEIKLTEGDMRMTLIICSFI